MLFRETISVYCENYTKYINTLCGKNVEFFLCAFAELRTMSYYELRHASPHGTTTLLLNGFS